MNEEQKDCMFQYATRHKIIANTELITRKEAEFLWDKYQNDIQENWDTLSSPQMCIWINCSSHNDYGEVGKDIDYRDCILEDGIFYKKVAIK